MNKNQKQQTGEGDAPRWQGSPAEQFLYNELELGIEGAANLRRSQQREIIRRLRQRDELERERVNLAADIEILQDQREELLAALKDCRNALDYVRSEKELDSNQVRRLVEVRMATQTAIAKAEGKQ